MSRLLLQPLADSSQIVPCARLLQQRLGLQNSPLVSNQRQDHHSGFRSSGRGKIAELLLPGELNQIPASHWPMNALSWPGRIPSLRCWRSASLSRFSSDVFPVSLQRPVRRPAPAPDSAKCRIRRAMAPGGAQYAIRCPFRYRLSFHSWPALEHVFLAFSP